MSNFSASENESGSGVHTAPDPTLSAPELEALMVRYQSQDAEAGGILIERLSTPLYRYFLGHVRDKALAEDLLQSFWLRIHRARGSYRPGEPVLPWLYAIAHRTRVDEFRKNRLWRRNAPLAEHALEVPEKEPETKSIAAEKVRELLQQLPPSQRDVILLMKVNGLSLEEVARATGGTVGSVKQKVHRGYEKLRALFAAASEGKRA